MTQIKVYEGIRTFDKVQSDLILLATKVLVHKLFFIFCKVFIYTCNTMMYFMKMIKNLN